MINKLVLIDDDEVTLMICELVIKKENFAKEIIKFKNGQEGIDYFKKLAQGDPSLDDHQVPELIMLDLNMPIMNGWEFLEEFSQGLEQRFPDTKVCILTSSVDPLDFSHSKVHECVIDFISKPLTGEALQELSANEGLTSNFNTI